MFDFITVVGSVVDVIVTERDVRIHVIADIAVLFLTYLSALVALTLTYLKPCPVSTLSQKSETVTENGDSLTFLRQCGQGLMYYIHT